MVAPKENLRVVVGLGKTGASCVRYLAQEGYAVAAVDTRLEPDALDRLKKNFPNIHFHPGGYHPEVLQEAAEIILSPGLPIKAPEIQHCMQRGIPVIGDIELFVRAAKAPIIAITGSNGKSTVTSLVSEMARAQGLVCGCGGNIGTPALNLLQQPYVDIYVLELSSFQLETTFSLAPEVATVLNITEDHMDRYESFEEYALAKQSIYRHSRHAVVNREDRHTNPDSSVTTSFGLDAPEFGEFGIRSTSAGYFLAMSDDLLMPVSELRIKGRHNWGNALAALAIGHTLSWSLEKMLAVLHTFGGLPHRCQWVATIQGVEWYNDSKGTNVGATCAAIEGLSAEKKTSLVVIAGGQGKGADFTALQICFREYVTAVVLIGEDADKLAAALEGCCKIYRASSMQEAVELASVQTSPGGMVLLSPACASFDMFENFRERGNAFCQAVKVLERKVCQHV